MEKFGDKGLKVKEKIPIGLFFKSVMVRPRPYKFIQSNSSAIFPQPIQLCQQQNRWGALNSLDLKNYFIFFISFQKTIWESEWRPGQLLFLKIYNPMMASGKRGVTGCKWFSVLPLEGIGWFLWAASGDGPTGLSLLLLKTFKIYCPAKKS